MSTPNMQNKLALIWRENVMKLMEFYSLSTTDMVEVTGKSSSTIQANFGGTVMKAPSSQDSITKIERAFRLNQGTLGRSSWSPQTETEMENPKALPPEQLASINIPIPKHKMDQIMRILLDD